MTANPVDLIGGLTTTANVVKADITAWAKARVPQVLADATELRNTVLAGQSAVELKTTGANYFLDTSDTTTMDNGVGCIISFDGFRFKIFPAQLGVTSLPQGRLTLTSGVALPTADVSGATTVYYTPAAGGQVTIYNGTNFLPAAFTEHSNILTNAATGNAGPAAVIPNANYDMYEWLNAGVPTLTRSDYWKKAATVTMTIAAPCVVTWSGSDFADGTPIVLTTSGALATGLTAGALIFVKRTGVVGTPTPTFNLSATVGGAAINTSGTQSGTHTGTAGDDTGAVARASGGNCEQQFVGGIVLNKNSITNGPSAQRGTYVGTIRTNGTSTVDFTFGTIAAGGGPAVFGLWNAYNQVQFTSQIGDSTAPWNYSAAAPARAMNGSNGNRCSFVSGLKVMPISVSRGYWVNTAAAAGAFSIVGFALNAVNTTDRRATVDAPTAAAFLVSGTISGNYPPQLGFGFVQAMEQGDGVNTNSLSGSNTKCYLEVATWQ